MRCPIYTISDRIKPNQDDKRYTRSVNNPTELLTIFAKYGAHKLCPCKHLSSIISRLKQTGLV